MPKWGRLYQTITSKSIIKIGKMAPTLRAKTSNLHHAIIMDSDLPQAKIASAYPVPFFLSFCHDYPEYARWRLEITARINMRKGSSPNPNSGRSYPKYSIDIFATCYKSYPRLNIISST